MEKKPHFLQFKTAYQSSLTMAHQMNEAESTLHFLTLLKVRRAVISLLKIIL